MNGLRLYGRYLAASLRAQMSYPASFVLQAIGQIAVTAIDIAGLWALFARFHDIAGWTFAEVALLYAVIHLAFAIADPITRGFDTFGMDFVRTGDFDRLLLRPRATPLQLAAHDLRLGRTGRLLQALGVLALAVHLLDVTWDPGKIALIAAAVAGGIALFFAIMVLQATLAFWTVEGLEIGNALTYGGTEAASYPLDIYPAWFKTFLTLVVPLACVCYFPVCVVLGRANAFGLPDWLAAVSPTAGFLFLALALAVWQLGVRRYTSTGS
jgi:ABC-2 type transport system permease protein